MPTKSISILGSYSMRNRGDEGLLLGSVKLFEQIFKNSNDSTNFNLFFAQPESERQFVESWDVKSKISLYQHLLETEAQPSLVRKILSLMTFLFLFLWSFIFLILHKDFLLYLLPRKMRNKIHALLRSDYVVYRSIDQFSDVFGITMFLKVLMQLIICINLRTDKVILHGQSSYFNEKHKRFGVFFLKIISKKCVLALRDKFSEKFYIKNNIKKFGLIPPPVIFITNQFERIANDSKYKILILPRAPLNKNNTYVDEFAQYLIQLKIFFRDKIDVTFMGQSKVNEFLDNDYDIIGSIKARVIKDRPFDISIVETEKKSLDELVKYISSFDLVVTERAISIVIALAQSVPTISIDPYHGKNRGLADLFGFEKYCIDTGELTAKFLLNATINLHENDKLLRGELIEINRIQKDVLINETKRMLNYAKE